MANYTSLQAAIDSGTTNMTAFRNNSGNDEGVDTVPTGISWFYYNSVQVTNLYVSGNSFVGFGTNTEHLKVNRQDAKSWYVWTETGTIGISKFFKMRWTGYSAYSQTSDAYAQGYDVFLIDNGQIFLNFFDVPTGNISGTNSLTCGSNTITYSITSGTACEYTFTPTEVASGTGWSVASGRPNVIVTYKTSGQAIFAINSITGEAKKSVIAWTESKPDGTAVEVSVSTDGVNYRTVTNGGMFIPNATYSNQTVYVKVAMSTSDTNVTPMISGLHFYLQTAEDSYKIVLEMEPLQRFESAVGEITVAYSGGTLQGEGGPVEAFSQKFTPTDLAYKGDQNDAEHIELTSVTAIGVLTKINYINTTIQDQGHIEMSNITAVGTLTHVDNV